MLLKRMLSACKFMYFFSCFFIMFGITSFAYVDPSAVTYIIQAVAGVFIAVGAVFTIYRHRIAKFFRKLKKKQAKKRHQKEIKADE